MAVLSTRVGRAGTIRIAFAMVAVLVAAVFGASTAMAAEGPEWRITSISTPTNLVKASELGSEAESGDELVITAYNVGGVATDGSPITISDVLPPGLHATGISGYDMYSGEKYEVSFSEASTALECSSLPTLMCKYDNVVEPGDPLVVKIKVEVEPGAAESIVNSASVSGGGAQASADVSSPVTTSSMPASFGLDPRSVVAAVSTRQAGAHPNLTTAFALNSSLQGGRLLPASDLRDIRFDFPPGLVGNTVGMPQCTASKASSEECAPDTVVGVATVFVVFGGKGSGYPDPMPWVTPVFNIKPSPGEPAAFIFKVLSAEVRLDTSLLSSGNYGVRVTAPNLSQGLPVLGTAVTIWGVPADHEGLGLIKSAYEKDSKEEIENGKHPFAEFAYGQTLGGQSDNTRVPLLSNPTQCSSALTTTAEADAWAQPGVFSSVETPMGTLTNCGQLLFEGSLSMLPDTLLAGAPAGYALDLRISQRNEPDGLVSPNVRKVVATLPMGTVISPSAAWGLVACSDSQFGLHSGVAAECPREAQVGTVQIATPALSEPLAGEVYLAKPDCEPCSPQDAQDGAMVRLFVQVIGEGRSGIVVKLEGTGSINQQTGQLTFTFNENPQLPFDEFKMTLGGGPRATLANPRVCGLATTTMQLTPWTTPFMSEISPSSTFEINQGCIASQFKPSFVAGTTNIQAGEYTPFTVSFGREDSDEFLNGLQMQMPPGLLGSLSGVPLCKEPQAMEGTCGQESLIGHTQVLTGPGADPFLVTGGQVFLTEGYRGAPFGLSIVVPAKAGPYTLAGTTGHGTVVVRAAINIDPNNAALTVTSDPLPTALNGIPLQLKVVNVTIDRPHFTLNPTSCAKMAITGTLTSKESAGVTVSSPFQVTNCAGLGFKPRFKVSTSGHTSRAKGASLDAKVIYPLGAKLANIAKVKVDLPKQLPSRLTTLQKACPAAKFNADPAECPAASVVGIARANTPILPVQLTGPVYFVSHGGEAFPNLIIVLQGYGVRVDLVGDTFISKAGITSSTFNQVPDVPISSFELYLPEGRDSALAANGNLCRSNLKMPTSFIAQNGMAIHQSTPISVTGCGAKASKASRARATGKRTDRQKESTTARKTSNGHTGNGRGNR
jgi:hypothetical protein